VYCNSPAALGDELELVPSDHGANVALLKPFDGVVWDRTTREADITFAAPSQVAVDCLTGNGRMPAEGDAVLQWMIENEKGWRIPTLPTAAETRSQLRPRRG